MQTMLQRECTERPACSAGAQPENRGIYCRYIKRPADLALSLLALILLSPVMLLIAALVRIKLGSPVIFRQKRPGYRERTFTLYKFRSMTDARDEAGRLLPDELRLTGFGRFLRSTSLDELPELINIIKGEMSFIGPRPLAVAYLPYYSEKERRRHDVKPGLSGLAQINGRNEVVWEERFAYDLQYVDHVTFFTDARIFIKTIWKVLRREGISVRGTGVCEDFHVYRMKERMGALK